MSEDYKGRPFSTQTPPPGIWKVVVMKDGTVRFSDIYQNHIDMTTEQERVDKAIEGAGMISTYGHGSVSEQWKVSGHHSMTLNIALSPKAEDVLRELFGKDRMLEW